jgi:hypothetical protein
MVQAEVPGPRSACIAVSDRRTLLVDSGGFLTAIHYINKNFYQKRLFRGGGAALHLYDKQYTYNEDILNRQKGG